MLLSRKLWTLGARLPRGPNVGEFRETALGPARISFRLEENQPGPAFLKAGPNVVTRLVDLDGGSASRPDKARPRSPDDGGSLPPCAPNKVLFSGPASPPASPRGCVQTEGKYPKLVNFVFEGKSEVLPASWMNR